MGIDAGHGALRVGRPHAHLRMVGVGTHGIVQVMVPVKVCLVGAGARGQRRNGQEAQDRCIS